MDGILAELGRIEVLVILEDKMLEGVVSRNQLVLAS